MVVTYAALMLHDGGVAVTEEKLAKVIKASGNTVEGYWPGLFAKALAGRDISDLMTSTGGAAEAPVAAAAAEPEAAKGGDKKKEAKKEDSDEGGNFDGLGGMFGDDY